jgi:hypothetical protein
VAQYTDIVGQRLKLLIPIYWNGTAPSREDMQKAYINESRVSSIDRLLIVQPYSPEPFRQGELPGPSTLMQVLRGKRSTEAAKNAWDEVERVAAKKKTLRDWPASLLLPCYSCTRKNNGIEVRKRLQTFTTATKYADCWKTVAKGADLECIRCLQARYKSIASGVIYCETCEAYRPDTAFSNQIKGILRDGKDGVVQCEACEFGQAGIKLADIIFEHCVRCNEDWPENRLQGNALQAWRANKQPHLITCAGCVVSESKEYANTFRDCSRCKRNFPVRADHLVSVDEPGARLSYVFS